MNSALHAFTLACEETIETRKQERNKENADTQTNAAKKDSGWRETKRERERERERERREGHEQPGRRDKKGRKKERKKKDRPPAFKVAVSSKKARERQSINLFGFG